MQYYISNNGGKSGPFEVKDLLANGLNRESLVWCKGMADWQPAMQVPEVAALLEEVPPSLQGQPYGQPNYQQPNQQTYQQPNQ